jgi:GTP-binding nuclear protein Ran
MSSATVSSPSVNVASSSAATESTVNVPRFKLIVVGDGGIGKTTYLKRYRTGEFTTKYIETLGVEVNPIQIYTSAGQVTFNVWDCAGTEKYGGLRDGYYIGAQAAILMFDLTQKESYKNVEKRYLAIRAVCPSIPIVLCGNKADEDIDRCQYHVKMADSIFRRKYNLQYYSISAKSRYNIEKPFLYIARCLLGNNELSFVKAPAVLPPEVTVSDEQLAKWTEELKIANESAGQANAKDLFSVIVDCVDALFDDIPATISTNEPLKSEHVLELNGKKYCLLMSLTEI